ncbi:hypothetical protein SYV04_40430 [Hyalangium sp. s54d21]|uniref:Uncharacterized protein n=1 Tax=Hyalangium rubrum TaxID=3103134 RepID=A0ABU5HIR7_9BACT|nr:hypothetical protein [Hyalangium sp. s54d21]
MSTAVPHVAVEEWEQKLKAEAHALIQQELTQEPGVSKPRTLSELQLLLDVAERIAPNRKKFIYHPMVLLVVVAVLVLVGMTCIRIQTTEIELSATMSGFDATLGRKYQLLRNNIEAASLTVTGASKLRLPDDAGRPLSLKPQGESGLTLMVNPEPEATMPSTTIKLRPFFLPANARFGLSVASARDLAIDIKHPEVLLQADFVGPVRLDALGFDSRSVLLNAAAGLSAWSGDDSRIDIQAAQTLDCIMCLPVPISHLAFDSTDEGFDGKERIVTPFSRIISGTLVLRDLGNKEVPLRLGTPVVLGIQDGELGPASIDSEGRISIVFHGNIDRLKIGSGNNTKNLMPSYLEWVAANQKLALIWGALAFIVALTISVWNWFRG